MPKDKTVTINGRVYDATTGMPLDQPAGKGKLPKKSSESSKAQKSAPKRTLSTVASTAVHSATQRSQTLQRRAARKSTTVRKPGVGRHMDIARSSQISRFAPRSLSTNDTSENPKKEPTQAPKPHPVAAKAASRQTNKTVSKLPSSAKQVKDAAIAAALAPKAEEPAKKKRKPSKKRFSWKKFRPAIIVAAILLLVGGGLYVTYISVPSLSVRFAAIHAGIKAKYPEYKPDGYSLKQPITYSDGQVNLTFESNSGAGEYTVTQTRSSWDSTAVLDNIVKKEAGENYIATQERGLTIYSYDKNTAWVNGGVLFQIENNTLLSGEQIRRIATSL